MNITLESLKISLLSACVGAAITYGALSLTSDEKFQHQKISVLETRVQGLETLLEQKEKELTNAHFFTPGAFAKNTSVKQNKSIKKTSTTADNKQAEGLDLDDAEVADTTPGSDQVLKDLMTLFVGDQRSFPEKITDFLASNPSKENVAIASTGVFTLAGNRDILPDHSLQAIYTDQSDPDLKRVVAQVASMRGDNSLIDMQIAEKQASLKSADAAERQKALVELAKTRYAGAANVIAPLLQDKDIGVKLDALLALRATGNQSHIRLVEELADDPNDSVSWLANDVISKLQNLSDRARTQLASTDIEAELPLIPTP
jgi:hypothetical protein